MSDLITTWKSVSSRLQDAFDEVYPAMTPREKSSPGPALLAGTAGEFLEFLEHNELELAWDTLAMMGQKTQTPRNFWIRLAEAADLMSLPDKAAEARREIGS